MRLAKRAGRSQSSHGSPKELLIDVLCFEGVETTGVDRAVGELNRTWNKDRVRLRFVRRKEQPHLGSVRPGEWLSENSLKEQLQIFKDSSRLLVGITIQRLAQDYFACHYPDNGTAILTTYNNPSIPAEILERQYVEFSLIYCFLDLVGNLSLWHLETRGCLFDECPQPTDIGTGLRHWSICKSCLRRMDAKASKRPDLKSIFAATRVVLAELGPKESSPSLYPRNGSQLASTSAKLSNSPPSRSSITPYNISSRFLTVDRALMISEIKRRWGISLGPDFADKPLQIASALQKISDKIFKRRKDWSSLRDLVSYNHTTDGLHFDIPGKRHRDHTLHQLYVAVLGMLFLDMEVPILLTGNGTKIIRRTLRSAVCEILSADESLVDAAWYVSAILHDHGYPLSNAISRTTRMMRARGTIGNQEILAKRLRLDFSVIRGLMAGALQKVVPAYVSKGKWPSTTDPEKFERDYQNTMVRGLNNAVDVTQLARQMPTLRYDHGVIGAANIGLIAKDIDFVREHVCRAIYDHNLMTDITFENSPLSFLLKMCDTLQEWDRIVYCGDGVVVRESKAVKLGPFRHNHGTLVWDRPLHSKFRFERQDQLALTEWDATLWERGTKAHLSLLKHKGEVFVDVDKISIEYERVVSR